MTERELFEAIGQVDDDLILAADAPAKKRRRVVRLHWQQVVSVAACACVFLGGVAVWRSDAFRKASISSNETAMATVDDNGRTVDEAAEAAPDELMVGAAAPQAQDSAGDTAEKDSAASSIAPGVAQCVQLDGVRYFETGSAADFAPDRESDGVIETSVDRDTFPETDGCSNFGTGYSYWVTGDGIVIVEIDGEYCEFRTN